VAPKKIKSHIRLMDCESVALSVKFHIDSYKIPYYMRLDYMNDYETLILTWINHFIV
jgi:hypothetical protein